jgi:hypothetical protein
VADAKGAPPVINSAPVSSARTSRDHARGVESLLWLAAGAAWAMVAVRAWSQSKKVEARRRTFSVSDRLLKQVFPHDLRT